LAEKLNLGLVKLECGVDNAKVFVAFVDAGFLFVLRGHLRGVGIAGAGLQLLVKDVELLLRELLLQGGDVYVGVKLVEGVSHAGLAVESLELSGFGVVEGARGFSRRFAGFGAALLVEEREDYLDAEETFVGLDSAVEPLQCGE
jgi:hypothetical protein